MNDLPRQKLRELIIEYGRSLCDDPRRCEALLKDYCGQHKREIFVLVSALKNRVADDLLKTSASVPQSILLARLHKRLEEELAMTAEAAHWAVESWALALNVINQPVPVIKPPVSPPSPSPTVAKVAPTTLPPVAETLMAGRYRDNGNGTVTDIQTGLQWMRFSLGQAWEGGTCTGEAKEYTWQKALDAAKKLNRQGGYAGYRDWRVPTKEELQTLIYSSSGLPKTWNDTGELCEGDYERPTIYQPVFPNTPDWWYWSSSVYADLPDYAWYVGFYDGFVNALFKASSHHHVRLARGGQ
ncbi:MAG TPA: DUF1566 domain-containing protein [Candidatus Competibacteraceae bacterium]|nr:DUF1566 domain-containing protein [Candidatus Competibacteraceae bacterium]HRZ07175.1 DUF1566 domain-containing protein [Candidatus Competibacteraceae bacterium]